MKVLENKFGKEEMLYACLAYFQSCLSWPTFSVASSASETVALWSPGWPAISYHPPALGSQGL